MTTAVLERISTTEKLACAERELRLRRRNYHRFIETGRMSVRKAAYEFAVMGAIADDYRAAAERERLL
jgi:hypothetical protein